MTRRFIRSTAAQFWWRPTEPDVYASAASLTIAWAAGSQTYTLTARTSDTVASVSADRTRLTIGEWGTDGRLSTFPNGQPRAAWLMTGGEVQCPVQVTRLVSGDADGGVVELSAPLPLAFSGDAALIWLDQSASISSAHVPATPQRVAWTVTYTPVRNGATLADVIDRGVLDVVRAPFATGLTHARFVELSPMLGPFLPSGQASWAPQIALALRSLIGRLQKRLVAGQTVDLLAGEQFETAHGYELELHILRGRRAVGMASDQAVTDAEATVTAELDRIWAGGLDWLDADDNGVINAGETGTRPGVLSLASHVTDTAIWDRTDTDDETPDPWDRFRVTDPR